MYYPLNNKKYGSFQFLSVTPWVLFKIEVYYFLSDHYKKLFVLIVYSRNNKIGTEVMAQQVKALAYEKDTVLVLRTHIVTLNAFQMLILRK